MPVGIKSTVMKPKDLRFPFPFEQRRPLISSGVLFIPKFYDLHREWPFPGWASREIFEKQLPIMVEYCSGNGTWIVEKAKRHPENNWIAVEKRFDRVQKIWARGKKEGLSNLFIVCGDALTFTAEYVPDASFDGIYINFPDPWPKPKHSKNRLLQENFIAEMARVAKKGANAVVVTDYEDYADSSCRAFLEHPYWTPFFPVPHFVTEWEGYGTSFFDDLWRNKKRTIHYLQFVRGT